MIVSGHNTALKVGERTPRDCDPDQPLLPALSFNVYTSDPECSRNEDGDDVEQHDVSNFRDDDGHEAVQCGNEETSSEVECDQLGVCAVEGFHDVLKALHPSEYVVIDPDVRHTQVYPTRQARMKRMVQRWKMSSVSN